MTTGLLEKTWLTPILVWTLLVVPACQAFPVLGQSPRRGIQKSSRWCYYNDRGSTIARDRASQKILFGRQPDNSNGDTVLETPIGRLSNDTAKEAMDAIWFHINKGGRNGADQALQILGRLLKEEASSQEAVLEKGVVFNVLKACQRAPVNINRIENSMELLKNNTRLWDPKIPSFVVRAMAKCSGPDAPRRAEALLKEIHKMVYQDQKVSPPDKIAYTAVLNSYAKRGMARKAELLLQKMVNLHGIGYLKEGPNTLSYNYVLDALARSKERTAPKRAVALLDRMQKLYSEGQEQVQPDLVTFNNLLRTFAAQGMARDAERTLQQMLDLAEAGNLEDGPDTTSYNTVMEALSKSRDWDAPFRAKTLLKHMQSMGDVDLGIAPTVTTFTRLLSLYANRGMAREAEELLQEMIDLAATEKLKEGPDTVAYNCVLHALSKSRDWDAPFRAKTLLNHMQNLYDAGFGNRPTVVSYTSLLSCYARKGMAKEADLLLQQMHELQKEGKLKGGPDVVSYNAAVDALAKSGKKGSPKRARALLKRMQEHGIQADIITYNSILKCYANAGKAQEAEELLDRMHELHKSGQLKERPNTVSYNCVLDALAKSVGPDTPQRMGAIWNQMRVQNVHPTVISYTSLLNCYARVGMAREAEELLEQMHALHDAKILKGGPDTISYNVVLHALVKCGEEDAPERATVLLDRMYELRKEGHRNIKPDKVTKACMRQIKNQAAGSQTPLDTPSQ